MAIRDKRRLSREDVALLSKALAVRQRGRVLGRDPLLDALPDEPECVTCQRCQSFEACGVCEVCGCCSLCCVCGTIN
jgi:hypothetical protein